jgi:hypothetical protein
VIIIRQGFQKGNDFRRHAVENRADSLLAVLAFRVKNVVYFFMIFRSLFFAGLLLWSVTASSQEAPKQPKKPRPISQAPT